MELTKKQVSHLLTPYQLGTVKSFHHIKHGFRNYSFFVQTSTGKYILRIGKRTKERDDIMFEILQLKHLKGLRVPDYVTDQKGNFINKYKGHNYSVYRYLEGETPRHISERVFRQVAKFLGKYHRQIQSFTTTVERKATIYKFPHSRIKRMKETLPKQFPTHVDEIEYLTREVPRLVLPISLPGSALHCDVKPENILVENGSLSGVIDFDNCETGPFIFDLGLTIIWFCTTEKGLDYKKAKKLIKYYESQRKLTPMEKRYLFQAVKLAYTANVLIVFECTPWGYATVPYLNWVRANFLNGSRTISKKLWRRHVIKN